MAYKILAVDDNPINLKLLKRALVDSNYEIYSASAGKEALELTNKVLPDLILLDVMMDEMDGYEVCRILQGQKETNQIPIIFLSAKNESVDKTRGLAMGAVDYLTKPFDAAELNSRVQTQLKIRKNNISLQRENQALREQIQSNGAQIEKYLNSIHTDYILEADSFICAARVISQHAPQTSGFIPLLQDSDQMLFLILSSSQKDYATLAVELLFEQFASGYSEVLNNQALNNDVISELIQKLMQKFSPDIYPVTFSFAIGWMQKQSRKLSFFGIRQTLPLIIDFDGKELDSQILSLDVSGSFAGLIEAHEMSVPEQSLICFYREGMANDLKPEQRELLVQSIKTEGPLPPKILKEFEKTLRVSDSDQLVSILQIT